ncbi:glycosyltransferase family 2 protein [Blastococcus sp. SYSU DS0973]
MTEALCRIAGATVVIVSYRTQDLVKQLVAGLTDSVDVVVVNNDPTARSDRIWSELPCLVLHADRNDGFAAGVNLANRHITDSQAIILCNPDVSISAETLRELHALLCAEPFDILSPTITRPDGTVWFAGGSYDRGLRAIRHDRYGRLPSRGVRGIRSTHFVSGCVLALSPNSRAHLLPLNEGLFMYWEDVELSLSARRLGLRMGVVSTLYACHDEGKSSSDVGRSPLFHHYQARNRLLVWRGQGCSRRRLLPSTIAYTLRAAASICRHDATRATNLMALLRGTIAGLGRQASRADECACSSQ